MAAKYSPDLARTKHLCKTKLCQACGLYINQRPLFDIGKESKVFWVGLSAVQFEEGDVMMPLSPTTNSGALIDRIEGAFRDSLTFYKTNLVKCVPLKNEKIRYPLEHEMEKCFVNFQWELEAFKPSVVFLLGKQVSTFVLKKMGVTNFNLSGKFSFDQFSFNDILFVPVQHPSYMLVYKRKLIERYIAGIQALFPGVERSVARKRA
jgi:uracil-DNA glycosylase family 4